MTTYPVGAYFCTQVTGWAGFLIWLGQLLCGRPSRYQHAGLIISSVGDTIEGQPGGARFGHLDAYAGRAVLICDGPVLGWAQANPGADVAAKREEIAVIGDGLRGTGYSVLDYFALALLHLHLPSRWVRARVESSGHLICSALVDRAYQRAGLHLFTDPRRLSGDVMPSDLADWADRWEVAHRDHAAA